MKRPARVPSHLSEPLYQLVNAYALAASAAGAGVLMLAQPAEARVVYTKAHHVIVRQSHFMLDLNHDSTIDFTIGHRSGCTSDHICDTMLYAFASPISGGNGIEGVRKFYNLAYALKPKSQIGPKKTFFDGAVLFDRHRVSNTAGVCTGSWVDAKDRYLGLKFLVKGKYHFGWARLSVTCDRFSLTVGIVSGYAYETVPNKPIIAGKMMGRDVIAIEPASLGHLAAGASAIPAWRVKRTAATSH
jgi:hypothetical protein